MNELGEFQDQVKQIYIKLKKLKDEYDVANKKNSSQILQFKSRVERNKTDAESMLNQIITAARAVERSIYKKDKETILSEYNNFLDQIQKDLNFEDRTKKTDEVKKIKCPNCFRIFENEYLVHEFNEEGKIYCPKCGTLIKKE